MAKGILMKLVNEMVEDQNEIANKLWHEKYKGV